MKVVFLDGFSVWFEIGQLFVRVPKEEKRFWIDYYLHHSIPLTDYEYLSSSSFFIFTGKRITSLAGNLHIKDGDISPFKKLTKAWIRHLAKEKNEN